MPRRLLLEAYAGYSEQLGLPHPSTVSLATNVSQVLFVVQPEGKTPEESRARGLEITREVLAAVQAAAADASCPAANAAVHQRNVGTLAKHLVKLLKAMGNHEEAAAVAAEHGLA